MVIGALILSFFALKLLPGTSRVSSADGSAVAVPTIPTPEEDAKLIGALVADEETILKLTPLLKTLATDLLDLALPLARSNSIFAESVAISDIGPAPLASENAALQVRSWPTADIIKSANNASLWRPLIDNVASFQHAEFRIISGQHPDRDMYRFESKARFEALALMKTGDWRSIEGKVNISWRRSESTQASPNSGWQITAWETEDFSFISSHKLLFVEVLDRVLTSPQEVRKLRHSNHYDATVKFYSEGMKKQPHPYFAPISANQKEGLAVADVNGDGFDDIYITVRIGKNMLLRNRGDGTFVEEAAKYGLDLPGHTTCALFADFDNDGDLDVFLGRSLLKCSYLENKGGRFHQPPVPAFMPMAAISMAAADYNKDGLLDVYVCTYRPAAPSADSPSGGVAQGDKDGFDWPDEFFPPELAREFKRKLAEHRKRSGGTVLDQLGPPNVLLVNRGGGRLEPASENDTIGLWRNSLQATWGDYDEDGDPDLFVSNDWAPSNLFRNDGAAGFKDISEEVGVGYYGFSMGASWGDYDNDGLEDIYVSNMYSDPGRRITSRIPGLGKMFVESAQGNWLYHRQPNGKFIQVAGLEAPAMTVMRAGWSWGGCFADFDNDSYLDLYVLSGYFTAPASLSSGVDLDSNLWRTTVRTDQNLSRKDFRFSPEWKRTPAPDNQGPEIDSRLAGVQREGDKIRVHSLNGSERNRFFLNRKGRSFLDISALTGLDNIADSRGFALLDYDYDGYQDIALVNANQPMFNLYHNETPAAALSGGMIAIRFVGGNRTPSPSSEFSVRDGFGARVTIDLGRQKLIREHRCGDGWSTQNSPTMIVGIGSQTSVPSVTVKWPSGKISSTRDIPEGTLLTVYENPADSPSGDAYTRTNYRKTGGMPVTLTANPLFQVAVADQPAKQGIRVRVYSTFATWSVDARNSIPSQNELRKELAEQGVEVIAVPIDAEDDNNKLAAYAREFRPSARLVNLPPAQRKNAATECANAIGGRVIVPTSVITDASGRILSAQPGIPSVAEIRRLLDQAR